MNKIPDLTCKKCGGNTEVRWDNGESSTGMDFRPLRPAGLRRHCLICGFTEKINSLDDNKREETIKECIEILEKQSNSGKPTDDTMELHLAVAFTDGFNSAKQSLLNLIKP